MKLNITKKRGSAEVIEVPGDATLATLKASFMPSLCVQRKSFKLVQGAGVVVPLDDDKKPITSYGITEGSTLEFKDLGPQISYRTVFVVEYAGPIALMAMYAVRPSFIYGVSTAPLTTVQQMYIGMFLLHFIKRELETLFVHKFSRPTMPLFNIVKNSAYYWLFAAFIGYFLCHPQYTVPTHGLDKIAAAAWALFEIANFAVHLKLSNMRKEDGETTRNVPKGPLFTLVSCPNYTFEVLGWVAFSLGCNVAISWMFTLVGLAQMTEWALKKHKGYIKADTANKKKKAIIPFVI